MRWTAWPALLVLLLAGEASAQVESVRPSADLDYQVAPGLSCPTAEQLRLLLELEMGFDAFKRGSGIPSGRVRVDISLLRPNVIRGRVSSEDVSGKREPEHEYEAEPVSPKMCDALVTGPIFTDLSSRLTLMLARNFRNTLRDRAAAACSSSKSAESPPCPESPYSVWPREQGPSTLGYPGARKLPEQFPFAVRLGAMASAEVIAAGWGSLGLSAEVGVRHRWVSLGIEVHGDPPLGAITKPRAGMVNFARISGALLACAHYEWFFGCGVGDAGRVVFPAHVYPLPGSTFYAAAGVRLGLEIPVLSPRLFVRTAVDLRVPIPPRSYSTDGLRVWETPGLGGGLALGALVELPR